MSTIENDSMVERVLEMVRVEQAIKAMLLVFVSEKHAKLFAEKIMREFLASDMVEDSYLECFEMIKQTSRGGNHE